MCVRVPAANQRAQTRIPVDRIEDTRFGGGGGGGCTSFQESIREFETPMPVECIRETSFIHSVSTNQVRSIQR